VAEALTGAARRRHLQKRRDHDQLVQGQPCTWRSLLIKVAAEVHVSARRIVVRLSAHWPNLEHFLRVCRRLREAASDPISSTG
jgi:hypothetical protein